MVLLALTAGRCDYIIATSHAKKLLRKINIVCGLYLCSLRQLIRYNKAAIVLGVVDHTPRTLGGVNSTCTQT